MPSIALPTTFWPAALCIAIAVVGGFAFNFFQFPLAFMLGAIAFTMTAAIAGAPIARPNAHIVTPMRASLGVLLGSAVTPELLDRIGALGAAAVFVPIFVVISGAIGTFYYIRVARFSKEEAFFCAVPGGLHVMTIYAEESGIDIRRVALAHALRITFVVLMMPFAVEYFLHVPTVNATALTASVFSIALNDLVLLFIAGLVGWYIGRKTGIPGGQMLGPLIVSATLHIAGLTSAKPPVEIIVISQIIIGASIGSRYIGETLEIVRTSVFYAFGHISITLTIAAMFAYVLHLVFDLPVITGILSFAPGGMSELGLIALGLGLDVGFVATIQVSRLMTIAVFAPWAFRHVRSFLKD